MSKNLKILFNYFLYFSCLIFVCIIGISKVFAFEYTYTVVGDIYTYTEQLVSTTYGSAPYNNPRNSGYAFGDVFQVDYIVSNYTFNANTNYQLESHLPNQVFTNVNAYKVSGLNGESCLTSYANSILNNDHYPRWAFQCPHQTNTITITIYNSTNQNLWSGTDIFNWSSAVLWSSSTPMTSSDTNSIINNQNQNTQDIINNQNQNTQDIINSQKTCESFSYTNKQNIDSSTTNKILDSSGNIVDDANWSISNYFKIVKDETITFQRQYWTTNTRYCLYDSSKTLISCSNYNVDTPTTITISQDGYIRYNLRKNQPNNNADVVVFQTTRCISKIDNIDDTLKNDNIDDSKIGSAFDDFNDFLEDNSTITQLIVLPITLYTAILNNLNGTCQPFNLGALFNHNLTLPCIDISQYLGNTLWTMIDIIISGFAIYSISKKMIKAFNSFTFMKEGDVLDD